MQEENIDTGKELMLVNELILSQKQQRLQSKQHADYIDPSIKRQRTKEFGKVDRMKVNR